MKNLIYKIFYGFTVIGGVCFVYEFVMMNNPGRVVYLGFLTMISGVMTILFENRPVKTEAQIRHNKKVENQAFTCLIFIAISAIIVLFVTLKD
jgi:hypothetical protein